MTYTVEDQIAADAMRPNGPGSVWAENTMPLRLEIARLTRESNPLIDFLRDIAPSTTLIQRNGSGVWYCRYGPCGGTADKLDELEHGDGCPVDEVIARRVR